MHSIYTGLTMFYDVNRSYEDNYRDGPFVASPDGPIPTGYRTTLFGYPLDVPFGIPAGPLINGRFIEAAWDWGYSVATYKTVRGYEHPCHPFPNTAPLSIDTWDKFDVHSHGIVNSYGVPSREPEVWQQDVRNTLKNMPDGSILVLSFMGQEACSLAADTGAPILEVNLSCPNIDGSIISDNPDEAAATLEAMDTATPLLVKIGYVRDDDRLEALIEAIHRFADGVTAINSIKAMCDRFPGRPKAGVSGVPIRPYALNMVRRIATIRERCGWKEFVIVGVGGVTTVGDYTAFREAGADVVLSATGAMWQTNLALEVRRAG